MLLMLLMLLRFPPTRASLPRLPLPKPRKRRLPVIEQLENKTTVAADRLQKPEMLPMFPPHHFRHPDLKRDTQLHKRSRAVIDLEGISCHRLNGAMVHQAARRPVDHHGFHDTFRHLHRAFLIPNPAGFDHDNSIFRQKRYFPFHGMFPRHWTRCSSAGLPAV